MADYNTQYEINCSYFVQKMDGTENKTVPNPKSWDLHPCPLDWYQTILLVKHTRVNNLPRLHISIM